MGIFNKLKKLFASEETEKKAESIELKESEIEEWLNENDEKIKESFKGKVNDFYELLYKKLASLEEAIDKLEKVNIKDRKVENKIIAFTENGRKEYAGILREFISNLRNKKDEDNLAHFNEEINRLFKLGPKAEFKASQLIGKEIETIRNIIQSIKELDKEFLDLNKELIEKKERVMEIRQIIKSIKEKKLNEEKLNEEISNIEQTNKKFNEKLENYESEFNKIKDSSEFKNKEILREGLKKNESALAELELRIKIIIDNKALERYMHFENDKTKINFLSNYLKDSVNSLMADENLEILNYFQIIKEQAQVIKLKENELKNLEINKSAILDLILKRKKLTGNIKDLKEQLSGIIVEQKLENLEEEKGIAEKNLKLNKKLAEKLNDKKEIVLSGLAESKNSFQNKINQLFDKDIKLTWN